MARPRSSAKSSTKTTAKSKARASKSSQSARSSATAKRSTTKARAKRTSTAKASPQVAFASVARVGGQYAIAAHTSDGTVISVGEEKFRSRTFAKTSAAKTWPGVPVRDLDE